MQLTAVSVPVATRAPSGATNACLVGDDPSILVDPAGVTEALDEAVANRAVAHVAVTHTHPDHVGAVEHYAERTGATVWCRQGRERRFRRATGRDPDATFREGTTLPVGVDGSRRPVTVLDTPGHAVDHVALSVPTDRGEAVVVGDLAVAEGSVVVGAPEGDMRAYLTALRRLHARSPVALYPGHGPRIDDPGATLARLVRHRLARERRVLAAVEDGARDVDAVLEGAYDKDLTGVRDLARATVVAHLEKLATERRVAYDRDRGTVSPVTSGR